MSFLAQRVQLTAELDPWWPGGGARVGHPSGRAQHQQDQYGAAQWPNHPLRGDQQRAIHRLLPSAAHGEWSGQRSAVLLWLQLSGERPEWLECSCGLRKNTIGLRREL